MTDRTYADFLHLPDVLGSVTPSTPRADGRVYAAEHFFLVAHQTSELWLKHVLVDLGEALCAMSTPQRDVNQATEHVRRAADAVRLLCVHVAIFARLQPTDFAAFRPAFGDASGAQSTQFHALRQVLGLAGEQSPLCRELLAAVAEDGTDLATLYRRAPDGGPLYRLAEAMADLSQAAWHWQLDHLDVVTRLIGRTRGTGGTDGAGYLARRLAAPFPELWEIRSRLYRPPVHAGGAMCPS
ncbi:MAG TPA: tryptophan 2,3-dioxygenase family protein [Pseudonocardiaceae bacterium]